MRLRMSALAASTFLLASPGSAAFHEIKVKEVFAGSAAHPNAQYVVLQAYTQFQSSVSGHSVLTFDELGAPTGTFTFVGPVGNGADQMTIFVATPDAAAIFDITADLAMTAVLDPAGGKVCWDGATPIDCVTWGSYGGADGGTPYNAEGGLIRGYAAQRRLDICLAIGELDDCDDTGDSASDFITALPGPRKNNGTPGETPPATCGNGTIEGLEGCDDNDTESGDGCSAVCKPEPVDLLPLSLVVDGEVTATSNGNRVFEPGETVKIEPWWWNVGTGPITLTGQLANFTGPTTGAPFYIVVDGANDYGAFPPNDLHPCDPATDCYLVQVEAQTRPSQHWDAAVDEILNSESVQTWPLHLGPSFPDVPTDHMFYEFIENFFHNGITGGCAGGGYCPANPVTRAQMAVFLLKASLGSDHVPPPCTGTVFNDVPCTGGAFDPWIEELASLGITGGCGGGSYCPDQAVTRQQMAVFVLKTLNGSTFDPPDCVQFFDDVPCTPGVGFSDWIYEFYQLEITDGCSAVPPLFCPTSGTNRGQMAVFLVRAFQLLLYGFPSPPG